MMLLALVALGQFAPLPGKKPPVITPKTTQPTPKPTVAPTEAPVWQPTLLWRTSVKRGEGTAAVGKEGVFVAGGSAVHRFNSEGRTDWSTEIGTTLAEVALDAKRVYAGSERGTLYALDRQSGAVAWKATLGSAIRMAPAVIGERLVVECADNYVYGLELASGTVKWKFFRSDGSLGYAAPTPGPAGSVLVCGESVVYRLSAATGQEIWRTTLGGKALGTPVLSGERVIVAGDGPGVVSLDVETGERRWRFRVGDDKSGPDWFGSPLVVGKTLFVTTYRRNVYALETATGKQKWSTKVLGPALARPALDEKRNVLYLSSTTYRDTATLTALNARTGDSVWDYKLGSLLAAPALAGGRLYLASTNGYFYAFSIQ
jgi:eukaryotic-like serine/threonine-protein kinase